MAGTGNENPPWFSYLEKARELAEQKPEFLALDFAAAAEIQKTSKSEPQTIASAWLSKFVRWGYVKVVGKEKSPDSIRPLNVYALTPEGRKCKLTEGLPTKYGRLLDAVGELQKVAGSKHEAAKLQDLFDLYDELADDEAGA